MASDNSFDVVSKVEIQEVKNAIDQASKEVHARFDLKDSKSKIELGVGGKDGLFDDIKVWNAEPAKK